MTEDRPTTDSIRDADSIVELESFEAVYRAWAPPLYRYCYRRLGSVENAEDATSQIFQQAFRGRAGFHGGSSPGLALPYRRTRAHRSLPRRQTHHHHRSRR